MARLSSATAEWTGGSGPGCFGFKLFGQTWVVYDNPANRSTFGVDGVAPMAFELSCPDGHQLTHAGRWLPEALALDLRESRLTSSVIRLTAPALARQPQWNHHLRLQPQTGPAPDPHPAVDEATRPDADKKKPLSR